MTNDDLDHFSRTLGTEAGRRTAASALALGGLAALSGLHPATARDHKGKVSAAKKKGKRGPTGPTGPAGVGGGTAGPTGPTGATGPSAGSVLGNVGRTTVATLPHDGSTTLTVKCPDNTATEQYFATGGGFVAVDDDVHIAANHQTTDGLGWTVQAQNNADVTATVEAWVLCLKVSTGS